MLLRDREDAGRRLADKVAELSPLDPVVLALPRGGVPVAAQIAGRLRAPLDVCVARKVGAPHNAEFGIGAVVEGSDLLVVTAAARRLGVDDPLMTKMVQRARRKVTEQVRAYRGERPLPRLTGRDVILVDDGLATGVTAEAALRRVRELQPRRLILAVPVCARESADRLAALADEVVYLLKPDHLKAVGAWYLDFRPVSDHEVRVLLDRRYPLT